jgi:hypothetical protein
MSSKALVVGVLITLLLVLVVGCTRSSEPTPVPPSQSSVLVVYQRSGGLAGLRDYLTIYSNGYGELQRKGVELEFTLQPSEVAHLKNLMEAANFVGLKDSYLPTNTGADFFEYVVSYQPGTGKMRTVRAINGAVPDALQPILQELNRIISSNS